MDRRRALASVTPRRPTMVLVRAKPSMYVPFMPLRADLPSGRSYGGIGRVRTRSAPLAPADDTRSDPGRPPYLRSGSAPICADRRTLLVVDRVDVPVYGTRVL